MSVREQETEAELEIIERDAEVGMGFRARSIFKFRHFLLFIFAFIFISLYVLVTDFQNWVNIQMAFILSDWQLTLALIMILLLTFGWYLIELLAIGFYFLERTITKRLTGRTTNRVRFFLIGIFFSLFLSFYIFKMDFSNPMIYFTATLFLALFMLFYIGIYRMRRSLHKESPFGVKKTKSRFPKRSREYWELGFKDKLIILTASFLIIFGILFLIVDYFTNQWGVALFLIALWKLININPIMNFLFIMIIIVTILWKPIIYLVLAINKLTKHLITNVARTRINRMRFLFLLFVISLLILKNLSFIIKNEVQVQIMAFCLSLFISILSAYLMRRYHPI